jgi:hypothetical protein
VGWTKPFGPGVAIVVYKKFAIVIRRRKTELCHRRRLAQCRRGRNCQTGCLELGRLGKGERIAGLNERLWKWAAANLFEIISRIRDSNQGGLSIFKPNLNWIQNKVNSNFFFGKFSIMEIWKLF